jgi:serine/threonine protein phosphatase PrpC
MVFQNLGNVRLILLRDKKFHLLTEDHTFGGSMKRKGPLKGDSAIQHPFGGVCSAWLGKEKTIEPRFKSIILQPNDVILIMTDGMADLRAPKILKRRLGLQLDEWGRHFSSVVGLVDFLEQQLLFHLSVKKPAKDDATSMIVGFTADDLIQPVLPPHKDRAKLPPSRPKPAPEWILPREAIDHRPITGVSEPGFGPE